MKRVTLMLIFFTILTKFFGFLREITLSYFYGASAISDAFIISTTIPTILFAFLGGAIGAGFVPLYLRIEKDEGTSKANRFTSELVNGLLIVSIFIILSVLLYTEEIVRLFASGFSNTSIQLTAMFTRITIFSILITSITSVLGNFLRIKNNYIIPALAGSLTNVIIIIAISISNGENYILLPIGYLGAVISQVIIFIPVLVNKKYEHSFSFFTSSKNLWKFIVLVLPIFVSIAIQDINQMVDKSIASSIVVGGVSALNYAAKINDMIIGVFVLALSTAIYPNLSKYHLNNNYQKYHKITNNTLTFLFVILCPASLGIFVFHQEIVFLVFNRGAFDNQAVTLTANALKFYSLGMVFYGINQILGLGFYSASKPKIPMIIGGISLICNILLNIYFYFYTNLGISGLAIATSIASIISLCVMILCYCFENNVRISSIISMTYLKVVIISIFSVYLAKYIFDEILLNSYMVYRSSILISIGCAIVLYSTVSLPIHNVSVRDIWIEIKTVIKGEKL